MLILNMLKQIVQFCTSSSSTTSLVQVLVPELKVKIRNSCRLDLAKR